MEDPELFRRMDEIEKKLDAVYASSEKMRKLFLWTVVVGIAAFILPLIGLIFAIPSFLSTYGNISNIGI